MHNPQFHKVQRAQLLFPTLVVAQGQDLQNYIQYMLRAGVLDFGHANLRICLQQKQINQLIFGLDDTDSFQRPINMSMSFVAM